VLGVHPDVRTRVGAGFAADGARVVLLGRTREEFGGSAWAAVVHRHLGGRPPAVDLAAERKLAALIGSAASAGVLDSAHDLSDGGLAIALAESCLRGGRGCRINLAAPADVSAETLADVSEVAPTDAFTALFSESAGRAIVSVRPGREADFASLCATHEVPATTLGLTGGDTLSVDAGFEIPLDELTRVWRDTLPALFG
jgi:phosphoribosylformylglycinamidine synthase